MFGMRMACGICHLTRGELITCPQCLQSYHALCNFSKYWCYCTVIDNRITVSSIMLWISVTPPLSSPICLFSGKTRCRNCSRSWGPENESSSRSIQVILIHWNNTFGTADCTDVISLVYSPTGESTHDWSGLNAIRAAVQQRWNGLYNGGGEVMFINNIQKNWLNVNVSNGNCIYSTWSPRWET